MSVVDTLLKSGAVAIVRTADQGSCQEAADAIVGAGSVVTKDVKPNTVVVGNPAQLIRVKNDK